MPEMADSPETLTAAREFPTAEAEAHWQKEMRRFTLTGEDHFFRAVLLQHFDDVARIVALETALRELNAAGNAVQREFKHCLDCARRWPEHKPDCRWDKAGAKAESVLAGEAREREAPCQCSPGDECSCAYDCDCRERYEHVFWDEGAAQEAGWRNTGRAATKPGGAL